MHKAEHTKVISVLNELLEMEISGVVRYLHFALLIMGPNRIPFVKWFHDQANEGYQHASSLGEKITALGGYPSLKVSPVPDSKSHKVLDLLKEGLEFEKASLAKYIDLLEYTGKDIALNEMARNFVRIETEHIEHVEKMIQAN
jgi:bacterioferritin